MAEISPLTWIRAGVVAGLVASGSYAFLVFGSGSETLGFVVASLFGLALGLAAHGVYQFMSLHRRTAHAQVALMATVVGSVVFVLMAATQLSIRSASPSTLEPATLEALRELTDRVHFGLDVAWDLYFSVGMWLFAFTSLTHPRLGRFLGASGMLIATVLLVLNLATFPTPPASAGSIDLGPAAGIWYLAITVQMFRSLGWAAEKVHSPGS